MLFLNTHSFRICSLFRKRTKFKTPCRGVVASTRLRLHDIGLSDIPNVSVADMKKELRIDGFPVKDSYACLIARCPICLHNNLTDITKESEPKIYVNKVTGYFVCPTCNHFGEWAILLKLIRKGFTDPMIVEYLRHSNNTNTQFKEEWESLRSRSRSLVDLSDCELRRTLEMFDLPAFPECARVLSEVRLEQSSNVLHFPLTNAVDRLVGYQTLGLENVGPVVNANERNTGGHFTCRFQRTSKERTAILVPSIKDVLTLAACRVPGSLIWWRSSTLPPLSLASLEPYSRVVVWGAWSGNGFDSAGGAWGGMARTLADKVGLERCHFVRPVEGQSSVVEASQSGLNVKALVAEAQPAAHRSVATFVALRQDILADLHNNETVKGVKWKRFPALSRLLQGHRRGELTVLTGPTGCGKTTLMAEYSLDLAMQGVTTLWGSFEIKNSRLARTMLQQMAGVPLEENLDRFDSFADKFEKLPIYFLMFHGAQSIKVVMEAVEHATYVHDIAHVIIDNVQFMMGVGDDVSSNRSYIDKYWKQDAIISSFRTFATRRNCHVTLVMHPRKERDVDDLSTNSIFGSAKASQEADNVLIIQDKRLTSIRGKKYLQIAKNRFSGDLGIVPLEFDKDSLSYAAKKKPKTATDSGASEEMTSRERLDDDSALN